MVSQLFANKIDISTIIVNNHLFTNSYVYMCELVPESGFV
jgi:hypothetical protein